MIFKGPFQLEVLYDCVILIIHFLQWLLGCLGRDWRILLSYFRTVRTLVHFVVSKGEHIVNMKAWDSQVKSGGAANVVSKTYYWVKLSLLVS